MGCVVSISAPNAGAVDAANFFGMTTFGQLAHDYEAEEFQRLGIKRVRINAVWRDFQRSNCNDVVETGISFGDYDKKVRRAAEHGIEIVVNLYGSRVPEASAQCPNGATLNHFPYTGTNLYKDYVLEGGFVWQLVQRYGVNGSFWYDNPDLTPHPIKIWEVWNETNFPENNPYGNGVQPQAYAKLLIDTSKAIRGAQEKLIGQNPWNVGTRVLFGGLWGDSHNGDGSVTAWPLAKYMDEIYDNPSGYSATEAHNAFDGLSYHPYALRGSAADVVNTVGGAREYLDANGDGNKTLWLTEIGWPVGFAPIPWTVQEQADKIYSSMKPIFDNQATYKAEYAAVFVFQDHPGKGGCTVASCWALYAGIQHENGTERPAFCAVSNLVDVGSCEFEAPLVFTSEANDIQVHQATLTGSIDPRGLQTKYHFEYGPTTAYGSSIPVPDGSAGYEKGSVGRSATLTDLPRETTFHYRLVASNAAGTTYGQDRQFTTLSVPSVTIAAADNVTSGTATLHGTVNPNGYSTDYYFEYGKTLSYGSTAPIPSKGIGSGEADIQVSEDLGELEPETTYYYRLVASNAKGTTYSPRKIFDTTTVASTFDSSFGSSGSGNGQFNKPRGVAVDSGGNTWVVDTENNRVQKFNSKGEYLSQFGSKGSGNGQFNKPIDIAITAKDEIWVSDSGNDRVQKFNTAGQYQDKFGSSGTGTGQFVEPWGIAMGEKDWSIWVVDRGHHRVEQFSVPSKAFIREVHGSGYGGSGPDEFNAPTDIAGETKEPYLLWVADTGNNRVKSLTINGEYDTDHIFGTKGTGNGQFEEPQSIAVKPSGNLLVGDKKTGRVQQLTPTGAYQTELSGSQLSEPGGIAAIPGGVIYVSNTGNNRVEKWVEPTTPQVINQLAVNVKPSEATIAGSVNPGWLPTTYQVEYGKTTAYGSSAPEPSKDLGSGGSNVLTSQALAGLEPETTYHFRIAAINSEGSTLGADQTFTTPSLSTTTTIGETQALNGNPGWLSFSGEVKSFQGTINNASVNVILKKKEEGVYKVKDTSQHPVVNNNLFSLANYVVGKGEWTLKVVFPAQGSFPESETGEIPFTIKDGYQLVAKHSGKCLDIAGGSTGNGTIVHQWECTNPVTTAGQVFTLVPQGNSYYQLVARNSGRCVDVTGASQTPGEILQQYTCLGPNQNNQIWQSVPMTGEYVNFRAKHSGQCMDIAGSSTANYAKATQWPCLGAAQANQLWSLKSVEAGLIPTKSYLTLAQDLNGEPGYVTVSGTVDAGAYSIGGKKVTINYQKEVSPGNWQTMSTAQPTLTSGGYYEYANMTVDQGNWRVRVVFPGDGVLAESMSNYQYFDIGVGYRLVNRYSGKCLSVSGNNLGNGTQMVQWTCASPPVSGDGQVFTLRPMAVGWYNLAINRPGPTVEKCVDVTGVSQENGIWLQQFECLGVNQANQLWEYVTLSGGWLAFRAKHSGKCADNAGPTTANGGKMQQYTCNWTTGQQWSLQAVN